MQTNTLSHQDNIAQEKDTIPIHALFFITIAQTPLL